ncbi:MAG: hypothetical protein HN929_09145 [Chloroflexi bacterium]|mgnify:CR=1 FL=1|nr:hypothetical protein [Chloroflexota bacterium]
MDELDEQTLLKCWCGHGALEVSKLDMSEFPDTPDDYYLTYWVPAFHAEYRQSIWFVIWERLKKMWQIAAGKEYRLYEINPTTKDLKSFSDELAKVLHD